MSEAAGGAAVYPVARFSHHKHRSFIGDPQDFDLASAMQFHLLTALGLREYHLILDIGCGPLSAGRLLIPYLSPERYFAIEPEQWLIEEGVRFELGHDQLTLKKPRFLTRSDFRLTEFGIKFDFMLAHSVFSHAAAPQIERCLREAALSLRPDGVLAASWLLGPEDHLGLEWTASHRIEYSEAKILQLSAAAGLKCKVLDWPDPAAETWALFSLPDAAAANDPTYYFERPPVAHLSDLRVIPGAHPGYVESILDVGESVLIHGWALHPETRLPAAHVLFANGDGRIVGTARVELSRSDVAEVHGAPALRSGFRARIGKAALGDPRSISCLSFTPGDRKAFVFPDLPPVQKAR